MTDAGSTIKAKVDVLPRQPVLADVRAVEIGRGGGKTSRPSNFRFRNASLSSEFANGSRSLLPFLLLRLELQRPLVVEDRHACLLGDGLLGLDLQPLSGLHLEYGYACVLSLVKEIVYRQQIAVDDRAVVHRYDVTLWLDLL